MQLTLSLHKQLFQVINKRGSYLKTLNFLNLISQNFRVPKTLTFKMRPSAQHFL